MTRIKLCGLSRPCDIEAANALKPEYIGFVFAPKSRRCVSPETAEALRKMLDPAIRAVGVFVREDPERIAGLLERGIIDLAQLHGNEDEKYIARLRALTDWKDRAAFGKKCLRNVAAAGHFSSDRSIREYAENIWML